jgi:hypothetical protein
MPAIRHDEPRVPRREQVSIIESMGCRLVDVRADLGDERACATALRSTYSATDISQHLEASIDRARELKAGSDESFDVVRDIACVAIAGLVVFWCTLPARASAGQALLATESELKLLWMIALGVGGLGIALGLGLLALSRFLSRRGA